MIHNLRAYLLYANFSKCEFWLENVEILRHTVSKEWIMVDPMMIVVVCDWARPPPLAEVCSFIRLAGY